MYGAYKAILQQMLSGRYLPEKWRGRMKENENRKGNWWNTWLIFLAAAGVWEILSAVTEK